MQIYHFNSVLNFGNHKGKSIHQLIFENENSYLMWCLKNHDEVCFTEEVFNVIKDKNIRRATLEDFDFNKQNTKNDELIDVRDALELEVINLKKILNALSKNYKKMVNYVLLEYQGKIGYVLYKKFFYFNRNNVKECYNEEAQNFYNNVGSVMHSTFHNFLGIDNLLKQFKPICEYKIHPIDSMLCTGGSSSYFPIGNFQLMHLEIDMEINDFSEVYRIVDEPSMIHNCFNSINIDGTIDEEGGFCLDFCQN